jgi:hypothetical protein
MASPAALARDGAAAAAPVQPPPAITAGTTTPRVGDDGSAALPLNLVDPESKVSIAFTPYMWLTGLSGDVSLKYINFNATASFVDILQNTNGLFGLMGALDARVDRLVFQLNGAWTYIKVNDTRGVPVSGSLNSTIKIDSSWTELFAGYRFIDEPLCRDQPQPGNVFVDGFVGGRLTTLYLDSVVTALGAVVLPDGTPLPPGATRAISGYQAWVEPFVGGRVGFNLCSNWSVGLRGDVGGFGAGGDKASWQAIGYVGYTWQMEGWKISMVLGGRALSQNYASGGFRWNEIVYGPTLGVQFAFAF